MQFHITHTTKEKLRSLSERLKYLAPDKNSSRNYIDRNVKSENLQLNLSLVLSHIIIKDFWDFATKTIIILPPDVRSAKSAGTLI